MRKKEDSKPADRVKDHTARRMQQLVDENSQLRQYVTEVMSRLRDNERLFSRLFELETRVLAATDVEVLCFTLLKSLREDFDLDMARFWIDHSGFAAGRQFTSLSDNDLVWLDGEEIKKAGLAGKRICLKSLSAKKKFAWLSVRDEHLGSLALLTLGDLNAPFGVLGLGSVDADRFHPDQGTDFLQHLAQIVSLGLENAFSRERLDQLASSDTLTGGKDMRFLQPHSHQPLSQWFGRGMNVACLYMDVDGWKGVIEKQGQKTADDMLVKLSEIIRAHIRDRDPLIRMNGDEFSLLLPGCSKKKAAEVAKQVLEESKAAKVDGEGISISIGIAYCPADTEMQVKELIESADHAMYVAKALGGGRLEQADDGECS